MVEAPKGSTAYAVTRVSGDRIEVQAFALGQGEYGVYTPSPMIRMHVSIDKERCKACGLCIPVCPHGVLKLSKNLNARGLPYTTVEIPEACTGCKGCALVCPEAAIEIERADSAVPEPPVASRSPTPKRAPPTPSSRSTTELSVAAAAEGRMP